VAAEEGPGFQLRLTRAAAEEVAAWEAAQRAQRIEAIRAAAGMPPASLASSCGGLEGWRTSLVLALHLLADGR
jgi:hypothetical protein